MSADNGIYILVTPISDFSSIKGDGFEYRVAYHMAVENYTYEYCDLHGVWDHHDDCPGCKKCESSSDPDIWIKNARVMWKDCKVFHTRQEALQEADRQYQEFMKDDFAILEYGISFIEIPRSF